MTREELLYNALLSSAGGGGGDEYEEVLLYENPAPDNSMASGAALVDFATRSDSADDYDFYKVVPWWGTEAESHRFVIVPGPKTVEGEAVSFSFNRKIGTEGEHCRIMGIYPAAGTAEGTNSIRAWAVFYKSGRYTDTNKAVPWKIYGLKKK